MPAPRNDCETDMLIGAWLRYHEVLEEAGDLAGRTSVADDHLWAIERVEDLVKQDGETAWQILMELFLRASSDYQLACLASGPLEDLLTKHGGQFIDRIENAASTNQRFRETLAAVWKSEIPDDIWTRIEAARGTCRSSE